MCQEAAATLPMTVLPTAVFVKLMTALKSLDRAADAAADLGHPGVWDVLREPAHAALAVRMEVAAATGRADLI